MTQPIPIPAGDTGFVGSITVTFKPIENGKIYYTDDGTLPSANNGIDFQWDKPIVIKKTTTIKAIHWRSNIRSTTVTAIYRRRRLPDPVVRSGGKTDFGAPLACTLAVNLPGAFPTIRHTLDGTDPEAGDDSSLAFTLDRTTTVKAYASHKDWDDSDTMTAVFTKLPPPAKPTAKPGAGPFAAKNLWVKLSSTTKGANILYTTDPQGNPQNGEVAGDSVLLVGQQAGDTITLRAVASLGGLFSPVMIEKYVYQPQVAQPLSSLTSGVFYDTATVFLASSTPGASVFYTLDGTSPAATTPKPNPFLLTRHADLRAIAVKPPQPQSLPLSASYILKLTAPTSSRPSGEFTGTLSITLHSKNPHAVIYYTHEKGVNPTPRGFAQHNPSQPISIGDSTIVRAAAWLDTLSSPVEEFWYVRRTAIVSLPLPVLEPAAQEFKDSLLITHQAVPGGEIRYTTDGTDPGPTSKLLNQPFRIDTTLVLKAKAFPKGSSLAPSQVRTERYVLTPSQPSSDPSASAPFPNRVEVRLSTRTRGGVIRFWFGDQPYNSILAGIYPYPNKPAGEPIVLTASTQVQALTELATAGGILTSPVLSQKFEIFTVVQTDTLAPETSRGLAGGFTFANKSASLSALARIRTTDSLGLQGFSDAGQWIQLAAVGGQPFPRIVFGKPAGQPHALYRLVPGGRPEFVSSATSVEIPRAGDYLVGIDVQPPTIRLDKHVFNPGDSATVSLTVIDNVASPTCDITGPGVAGGRVSRRPDTTGALAFNVKAPAGGPATLWFRARASDNVNASHFPADTAAHYVLPQVLGKLSHPGPLRIGDPEHRWDLVGLPVGARQPMTWGQIRGDNPEADFAAVVWQETYVPLQDRDPIRMGAGFWVGSLKQTSSLSVSKLQTGESEADGTYRMTLQPGWNQVTNPGFEPLFWPASRLDAAYDSYRLKGLYSWNSAIREYATTDMLETWKGYFVYYHGERDTIIDLSPLAARKIQAKTSARTPPGVRWGRGGVSLSFDFGSGIPLRLAAKPGAEDAASLEDEPRLPSPIPGLSAWSARTGRELATDQVRFLPGRISRWDVVLSTPAKGGAERIAIDDCFLPPGHEAWAISPARRLRIRVQTGASLPAPAEERENWMIVAGPAEKVHELAEIRHALEKPAALGLAVGKGRLGPELLLTLPEDSEVEALLCNLSGRRQGGWNFKGFAAGRYVIPLDPDGVGGVTWLRVHVRGPGSDETFIRKLAW